MVNKVNPLPPTSNITDPQARAFCDALVNAWELRNGQIGHNDDERFITKKEFQALTEAAVGRIFSGDVGASGGVAGEGTVGDGSVTGPGTVGDLIDKIVSTIVSSPLYEALTEQILLLQPSDATIAELNAIVAALQQQLDDAIAALATAGDLTALQDGITQINFIDATSTSASALQVNALKLSVYDAGTGLAAAWAGIAEINNVDVTSTSANAQQTATISAQVNNPTTGLAAAHAYISEINDVSATSDSANAQALYGLGATVNDPTTGLTSAHAHITQINNVAANTTSANAQQLYGLKAAVEDPNTGLAKATADIIQLNYVASDSGSASARALDTVRAQVNNGSTGLAAAHASITSLNDVSANSASANARQVYANISAIDQKNKTFYQTTAPTNPTNGYNLKVNDLWFNSASNNTAYRWNGSTWVITADARIAGNEASIVSEENTRTSKDNALAAVINTIWTTIGSASSIIQDGQLAAVTPAAGTATKWNQVQTAVTDPNTGLVAAAAIRSDYNTYVSNVDGKMNASYTLRSTLSSGGATIVGGFGLMATSGAGSSAGPTIDFGVAANKFFIAAPSSGYSPGDSTVNSGVPFVVYTTPQTINGVSVPAGVYIKSANIETVKADRIDTRGLTVKDGAGNIILSSGVPLDWSRISGANKPADGATKNTIYVQSTAPGAPINGDVWVDTTTALYVVKVRYANSWTTSSNYLTNTNQLTDGAGLGTTAIWSNVTGANKPADGATKNTVWRQSTTPAGATTNDVWFNTSSNSVYYYNGASWILAGDRTSANTAAAISGQGAFATLNQLSAANASTYIAALAVDRLYITGIVFGSVAVPNNGSVWVAHNSGRYINVTAWTDNSTDPGELAYMTSLTPTHFELRAAFSQGATVYYAYF